MEAAAYDFENLVLFAFQTESFHTGLSVKEKILQRVLQHHVRCLVLREVGKKNPPIVIEYWVVYFSWKITLER